MISSTQNASAVLNGERSAFSRASISAIFASGSGAASISARYAASTPPSNGNDPQLAEGPRIPHTQPPPWLVPQPAHAKHIQNNHRAPRHRRLANRRQRPHPPADYRRALRRQPHLEPRAIDQMHHRQMERLSQIDEAYDLAACIRRPRPAVVQRIARHQRHRPPVQPRQSGDDRPPEPLPDLEEAVAIRHPLDDPAHVVRLLPIPRHRGRQTLIGPPRIVPTPHPRRQLPHRPRQIRQESPSRRERRVLSIDRMIHRATARLDLPPPSSCLPRGSPNRSTTGGPATKTADKSLTITE